METVANSLIQNNVNSSQKPDPKSPEQYLSDSPNITGTVINSLIQNNGNSI
jgi:hypothetical protein